MDPTQVIIEGATFLLLIFNLRKGWSTTKKIDREASVRDAKLDQLISREEDIQSIKGMQQELAEVNAKLKNDWKLGQDHEKRIKKLEQTSLAREEGQNITLKSLLAIMEALKDNGIDGRTEEAMKEIKDYLITRR